MAKEVAFHLDQLAHYDIPIAVYHFDGQAWANGNCDWNLGDTLLTQLQSNGVRALLHFWGGCDEPADYDRVLGQLGNVLGGFYLDDNSTDEMGRLAVDWAQARLPKDAEVVFKAYAPGQAQTEAGMTAYGHTAFVNDLHSDFEGLRTGIERVFSLASTLPAPFNEFTGYDVDARPDEETYFRRIHFGALQPVMDHSPWLNASPWLPEYSPALVEDFRYFSWLHYELVPYLHSYDWEAYETGLPILRERDPAHFSTKLGEEIFVAYVTEPGTQRLSITLPAGEWIDYWEPSRSYSGTMTKEVPLGREPIFIKNGAIIPLQVSRAYTGHGTRASADSLTILVYPRGQSTFRYRDDDQDRWITFRAELSGDTLTLGTSYVHSKPLLYRIERWRHAPKSVQFCGTNVYVNGGSGSAPEVDSEEAVNGATHNAWYYDAKAERLIVKTVTEGIR
jgi:hypothetical protein